MRRPGAPARRGSGHIVSTLLTAAPRSSLGWPGLARAREALAGGTRRLVLEGLWGSAKALAAAGLLAPERPACLVTASRVALVRLVDDLRTFTRVLGVKASEEIVPLEAPQLALWRGGSDREGEAERVLVLDRLLRGEALWVVTTPQVLGEPLVAPDAARGQRLVIASGDGLDREALLDHLALAGYERVQTVGAVGQWALRGAILDIFSPAHPTPIRIELDGDVVESLRAFDPSSQRSSTTLQSVVLLPLGLSRTADATLLAYFPREAPVLVEDPALLEPGVGEPDLDRLIGARPRVACRLLVSGAQDAVALETRSLGSFRGQFRRLASALGAWRAEGFRVRLMAADGGVAARFRELLADHDLVAPVVPALLGPESLAVVTGVVHTGFECPGLGLVCLGESELFGAPRLVRRRGTYARGSGLSAFTDLGPGDLVVHAEHGIGRYQGLVTLTLDGQPGDYLLLDYAEGDRLYLPVQRLGALSRYVGAGGDTVRLDKLGGTGWQKTKEAVRASVRRIAGDLLRLYAARQVRPATAIGRDTPWQHEFEAAFPFEETPDQLEAITRVKADLERPRPMDRLVSGDVGYGKTEVAMRAALKVALDGHQVAVLVPTTILAQQHWNTFRERFGPFPLRVEMLSRFRSPREQRAVVAGLKAGAVDVVIGTHRLLSRDVAFRDLGLIVVDEEHRFGVTHKERLKTLRETVHALTLTATPIPRTLSMAFSGLRDLSVIDTPPADRLAIETVVCRFDTQVIREALERELGRGGQVFVVHNRIQSLSALTRFIERLCPRARVAIAHGQMPGAELERTMCRYVAGDFDVLVSTAIVESGLDIPASNTIVINRADRLGLAQLYQLRGRVGRDRLQAYAYLLIPADGRVDEAAAKRLRVIQELSELGSGLKVALRDLELRGAGNLLGAEQHGQLEAIGLDLYLRLLDEAVRELRGEPVEDDLDPVVTVDVAAYLPDGYVAEPGERLALYRRLVGVRTPEALEDCREELRDRFGALPVPADQLLDVVTLRLRARALRIEKLEVRGDQALITFARETPVSPERLLGLLRAAPRRLRLIRECVLEATLPVAAWRPRFEALLRLLQDIASGRVPVPDPPAARPGIRQRDRVGPRGVRA